ncbi:uncharacterized protein J3D65DRAFT_591571 [Phyllosticta citribraziliensis]|uniref:Smr domain-containing protein n=1 Tax=Phyllosticta citribraziliensis TaxID=989973 RepID=A0ABR1LLR7_9PEZI
MDQPGLAELEREYCPALDAALVYAIYSDYEGQPNALDQARAQLDLLRDSAVTEQFTDFDPSGTSGQGAQDTSPDNGRHSQRSTTSPVSETDATSLSHGMSSLWVGSSSSGSSTPLEPSAFMDYFQGLDDASKEAQLAETFPTLKLETIKFILKKSNSDYEKTTDELLNHVLFEELDGVEGGEDFTRKGIDAFAADTNGTRGRKKKGKKKQKFMNLDEYSRTQSEPASPVESRWDSGSKDVSFISSRVDLDHKMIWSLYHKNSASMRKTIDSLLKQEIDNSSDPNGESEPNPLVTSRAIDLMSEFSLEPPQALALIRLTHPSSAAAHELAKALIGPPVQSRGRGNSMANATPIIPQYAPLKIDSDVLSESAHASSSLAPSPHPNTPASLAAQRAAAFSAASSLHCTASSTNHRGAAASYYAQLGRDYDRAYRAAVSSDADELVASQSSATSLDLHGVSVRDALRIARSAVQQWWDGLGERRIKGWGDGGGEYRIVTGVGRHSDGGKAKIGPAVGRMLVREGWKVEVGSGVLSVTGRRARS